MNAPAMLGPSPDGRITFVIAWSAASTNIEANPPMMSPQVIPVTTEFGAMTMPVGSGI